MAWQTVNGLTLQEFSFEVFLNVHGSELGENEKRFFRSIVGENVLVRRISGNKTRREDTRFHILVKTLRIMNKEGFIKALGVINI